MFVLWCAKILSHFNTISQSVESVSDIGILLHFKGALCDFGEELLVSRERSSLADFLSA